MSGEEYHRLEQDQDKCERCIKRLCLEEDKEKSYDPAHYYGGVASREVQKK